MSSRIFDSARTAALTAVLALAATAVAQAQTQVWLAARSFDRTLPGATTPVPTWGFASCDATFTTCSSPVGPRIDAAAGTMLTVHLKNELAVPVSLLIPGQAGAGDPVMVGGRVQSFTQDVAPGGTHTYTWPNLRAGTYLFHSGTQPSIQVPMGLHGALVVSEAGYPGAPWDVEALIVYSEIDAVQNAAVAAAVLANPLAPEYPAAIDYSPQFFLVNGHPYDSVTPPAPLSLGDGTVSRTALLRLVNAGVRSHAAAIVGLDVTVRAEDGNLYPTPLVHSSVLLPAGKTLDTTVAIPAGNRTWPIYDRMLDLTNADQPNGGLLAYLQTGTGTPPGPGATVTDDTFAVTEEVMLDVPAPGVLANDGGATDAALVNAPAHGTLILSGDGSFSYTPDANYSGQDAFTYAATTAAGRETAVVTLNISRANDAPVALVDTFTNNVGATVSATAPGVLGNDSDPDGDPLTAVLAGAGLTGLTLNADGSFTYTGPGGTRHFAYRAFDGTSYSAVTWVTIHKRGPNAPALTVLGPDGEAVTAYRWVLEQDDTYHPDPANPSAPAYGTGFHRSYMPVIAQGCVGTGCANPTPFTQAIIDRTKWHYVSVLPANAGTETGYTLGGASIKPHPTAVTVRVNKAPVATAQISVFVFRDDAPTNGAPDGNELGLGGVQINLEDGGGRYGAAAGPMMFDAFGQPLRNSKDCGPGVPTPPTNLILTCPDGTALIRDLAPGKYGVTVTPPSGGWVQTSTIEGKRVIDAWVKAGEPPYFQEFGAPGYHVFIGFVNPALVGTPTGPNTVTGRVTNLHMSRPPDQVLWDSNSRNALAHTTAWVGLNSAGGTGPSVAVAKADGEGNFTLGGIPDGSYQLVVWDEYLDQIIAFRAVTLTGGTGGSLGNVPVFNWFSRLENHVFQDNNENGVRDPGEVGLAEQNVNIRFRDGSLYLGAPTDLEGYVPFDEVFPFFNWLVAEVDFVRHKATGVTVTVDGGGQVDAGGVLRPQVQADGTTTRTETGPVLTQAFQGFLGQTNVIEWGKKPYAPGENGGISGIVYYSVTRAEEDPRLAVGDPWEPGIANVTVRLYREVTRADGSKGLVFLAETQTDSWDANQPSGCPGAHPSDPVTPLDKCYDGLRNFNQVRPGVFDGGYAFNDVSPGRYVVEVIPPLGYEIVKEEDVNVGFGDVFETAPVAMMLPNLAMVLAMPDLAMVQAALGLVPGLAQPECVGPDHLVPAHLSLFPLQMIEAPFAGATRPLCTRKAVVLQDGANGVADFHLFTQVPVAAHAVGMILDDLAQEFNPASPQFGEKWAPPFVPVAFYDWTGREISRVYSDQWGNFNALLPSSFSANLPMFSGYSPGMHMSCMNDPGPIGTGANQVIDPQFNPRYGTFCYTFQYMPGTTLYLDTPVLPTAAFAAGDNPVDCAYPDRTPMIRQVDGDGIGPHIPPGPNLPLIIYSAGRVSVPNPAYDGPSGTQPKTITRDYGFGSIRGTVTLNGIPLDIVAWTGGRIDATLPSPVPTSGQLVVTRGDSQRSTLSSVTVHVESASPRRVTAGSSIQAAIDAASPGELIIVEPGTYTEKVVVWKPVRLQGAGPGATFINAVNRPTEKLQQWRDKVNSLVADGSVSLLPGQAPATGGIEPGPLNGEQGAGVTVLGPDDTVCGGATPPPSCFLPGVAARIDGFSFIGGDSAGAIYVNGWAHGLEISNNHVNGNGGFYHGGIGVGTPFLELTGAGPFGFNRDLRIHHNQITQNGALGGAGGGVSLCTGTDGYVVSDNWICGNFTKGDGGGIGHFGFSDDAVIANNSVLFNQSFDQGLTRHGGGIFISGELLPGGTTVRGSGDVFVERNLIQGNHAAAGHGGGVRAQWVNGDDVQREPGDPGNWYGLKLESNIIVNNVSGWAGGGVSLLDAVRADIVNNTIANNDSTATVGAAFVSPTESLNQPAGIVSELNSPALAAVLPPGSDTFSNPRLANNIIWANRSFRYVLGSGLLPNLTPATPGECAAGATYWDLGVLGTTAFNLSPTYSVLTNQVAYDDQTGNRPGPPLFGQEYCNGARSAGLIPEVTTLQTAPALDEGGNFIDVRYGPITLTGNYHIQATSPAVDTGTIPAPGLDFDRDGRAVPVDIGADEVVGAAPRPRIP